MKRKHNKKIQRLINNNFYLYLLLLKLITDKIRFIFLY